MRLRLINASSSRFYRPQMEEHTMFTIASDGSALPAPQAVDELLLVPGERAEVMIQGSRSPGSYRLLNLPYNRGAAGMMMGAAGSGSSTATTTLLTLVYEGRASQLVSLPSRLVSVDPLPDPSRRRTFDLGQGMGSMQGGMSFIINGRTFDPRRVAVYSDEENYSFRTQEIIS